MRFVALLLFGVQLVFARRHTLEYFYTVVSGVENLPECTAVGLVDDQQFMYFDSNTMKAVPKTEWIRQNEEEDYWNTETSVSRHRHQLYKSRLEKTKDQFNESMSKGVHTLQKMFGCELDDDGNTQGYMQYGFDGEDFISFDKHTLTWTAANPQAVITKNQCDADKADAQYTKAYLENECIERLKKFTSHGTNTLERKDPPEVSLLQKSSLSPVICHATSFYPRNIIMSWKKNNEDVYEDVEVSSTLPNEDGSFQKSISLSVEPEEWKKNPDVYRCVIQHVGAGREIVVLLNEKNIKTNTVIAVSDNTTGITVGCLVAFSIISIAAIIGLILWRNSRQIKSSNSTGYVKGSITDTDSERSDGPVQGSSTFSKQDSLADREME